MTGSKHASSLIKERSDKNWDYVALGDSTPTGYGLDSNHSYVQTYASYLEKDLNINVIIHNWSTNDIRTVSDWVKEVQTNKELRVNLSNAEVITIWLGWHNVIPSIMKRSEDSTPHFIKKPDSERLSEVINPMQKGFDDLLSEITSLASPNETLILIADVGIPSLFVRKWKEYGSFDLWYQQAYKVWRDYIIQAADKNKIHVVPTHEVINNPDSGYDLPTKYLQADGVHFNKKGHKLIADAHREIGYQYSKQ